MQHITIINETAELVRIAIYKPDSPTFTAWQVIAPPPGGQTVVPIPESDQGQAESLLDPSASTFYLAVVDQFAFQGSQLICEKNHETETPILVGGTARVTGSSATGYSISTSSFRQAIPEE